MTVAASISRDACRPAEVGPAKAHTISDEMRKAGPATAGFDYLRIGLALAVVAWHSVALSTGSEALVQSLWTGRLHFLLVAILPMFFGLSGFLVAGSLARTRLHQFVMLRALRLVPALAVEVTLSALILGPVFTLLPLRRYFSSPEFFQYFGNIVGLVRFTLPGVFETNPVTRLVNPQLWTVPFELECYFALVTLSVTGVLNSRRACVGLVALLSVAGTACALSIFRSALPEPSPDGSSSFPSLPPSVCIFTATRSPMRPSWGSARQPRRWRCCSDPTRPISPPSRSPT